MEKVHAKNQALNQFHYIEDTGTWANESVMIESKADQILTYGISPRDFLKAETVDW